MSNSSIPATSAEATEMIHGFLGNLKDLISSPAKGAKEIVENGNFIISGILMIAQAALAGVLSLIFTAFHLEMGFGDCIKYFFLSIFFSLLLTGITFGCAVITGMCMKGTNDAKKILNALSLRCIAVLPFTIIAVPVSLLFSEFALLLVFICELLGFFYEYFGFKAAFGLDESKTAYLSVIVSIVYIISFAIIFKLIASDLVQTMIYSALSSSFY